jgi:VWFA-related protein
MKQAIDAQQQQIQQLMQQLQSRDAAIQQLQQQVGQAQSAAGQAAQKADTIVYVLLIFDPRYPTGSHEMQRLAQETGGRMIPVGNNPDKLKKALQQVSDELRSQYYIGYTPSNRKSDGSFRKVEVRTKSSEAKVQARKGYYASNERP